jgi:hypothetical protein
MNPTHPAMLRVPRFHPYYPSWVLLLWIRAARLLELRLPSPAVISDLETLVDE